MQGRTEPRLSIGVPVYNGERFLPILLACLAQQTYEDYEIIISDNASTDRTAEICKAWMERDGRIQYHRNTENIGACANFNRVFELSTAPLFKWAACDDTYHPDYLAECVRILDENPDVILAQSDVVCVEASGQPFQRDQKTGAFVIPGTDLLYYTDPVDIGESSSATRRFYDVLCRCRSNAQIFGVMRREALAMTALLPTYLGSEKRTVLELALVGRFKQCRRPLFNRCYHPDITEAKVGSKGATYIAGRDIRRSRALTMLKSFLGAPNGKPIGWATYLACYALLAARGMQFASRAFTRSDARYWPFRTAWGNSNTPTDCPLQNGERIVPSE
ncbi:MAG: glycosyltransferase family A protein [Hyphomicrobiaceae bacterium]